MTATPTYAAGTNDPYSGQPPWGTAPSDSLQYELYFGSRFVSIRALKFPTCSFTYAWMFDGQSARPLFTSYQPLHTAGDASLNARHEKLAYEFGERGGRISVSGGEDGTHTFDISEANSTLWRFPPDDIVIHQPSLNVIWRHGSETTEGMGYCKRYTCGAENEHMYWRFITGPIPSETGWFWTAEAAFNLMKYDYFKLAGPDGTVRSADQPGTWHRDRVAHGVIDGVQHLVEIEDLGRMEFEIRNGPTNMKISQAYCRASFAAGGTVKETRALNEIACGIHA